MLTSEENDILTQTDAETPMGEYFRRFWQPVALSEELPEPDGALMLLLGFGLLLSERHLRGARSRNR